MGAGRRLTGYASDRREMSARCHSAKGTPPPGSENPNFQTFTLGRIKPGSCNSIPGLRNSNILQDKLVPKFHSQFGVVHPDGKVEAREMDVEGRTTGPLDQNDHFLPVQPDQRADSRVVFPCTSRGRGKDVHGIRA